MPKFNIDGLEVSSPEERLKLSVAEKLAAGKPLVKLTIDGLDVEVVEGTKVIEAAERVGIIIPRFCYLKALGSVGACRMCAVKMLQGPFKGVQMSCMIDAQEGMVVSTTDEEAVDFRRHVIEWLMLNHPHDCPVCDEGGQCLLQDMTVSGGHGLRRYLGSKRTYHNQYLGVFIAHEMNRCIHCYRCSRFYQEYAGYRDLGAVQIANRTYFGRFEGGSLESPFSGNLVDICPTGVYTDSPARYRARRWDLERAPSLCIHCSLGCNTIANARYREIVRAEGRLNAQVNGAFICDRGRFGFSYGNNPERPREAKIHSRLVSWNEALAAAGEGLLRIARDHGQEAIACLSSVRSSLEAQSMLKGLSKALGWNLPYYFFDPEQERKVRSAVSGLDERLSVSMSQIEKSDFILAVGVDPVNEAPMLALAMRQAVRQGATAVVIDPRPISLPLEFEHLPVLPSDLDWCLENLIRKAIHPEGSLDQPSDPRSSDEEISTCHQANPCVTDQLASLALRLGRSLNPVIVCGVEIVGRSTPALAADQAELLKIVKGTAGLFYVLPGANALSAGLLSCTRDRSFEETVEAVENGTIKAVVAVESDPFFHFPDTEKLTRAMNKLDLLIVMDYLPTRMAEIAHVFIPTLTMFETSSTFVNQEGRLQLAEAVHSGGVPISQTGGGSHPPRAYGSEAPGFVYKAAWQTLAELGQMISNSDLVLHADDPLHWLAQEMPSFQGLKPGDIPDEGIRILPERNSRSHLAADSVYTTETDDTMKLLLVDWTFGTEELSSYSEPIRKAEKEPTLSMHIEDGMRAGLSDGDTVAVKLNGESVIQVRLHLSQRMARKVVVLPRHRQLAWQKLKNTLPSISLVNIEKAQTPTGSEAG